MSYYDYLDKDDPEYLEYLERNKDRFAAIDSLRDEIIAYADNDSEHGWFHVKTEHGAYKFPKRALIHNVFGHMPPLRDLLPEYEPISPPGLKLQLDDRFHSDLWLGAGFDLDKAYEYDTAERKAYSEAVSQIEDEFRDIVKFDFTVLANGTDLTWISAMVYEFDPPLEKNCTSNIHIDCADKPVSPYDQHRCIVIPHAGIEYDIPARNADIIITEQGGKLAHLAIVSREKGKLLIRIDNACERFPRFSKFSVDLNDFTLEAR